MAAADASAVNTNAIKLLLANGVNTVLANSQPIFSNGSKSLQRNLPVGTILIFVFSII